MGVLNLVGVPENQWVSAYGCPGIIDGCPSVGVLNLGVPENQWVSLTSVGVGVPENQWVSGAARTVTSDGQEPLRRAMNERMSRPEGRAVYRRRKAIVEPVFGQIKNAGFRGFGVRGKLKPVFQIKNAGFRGWQVEGGQRVLAGLRRAQRQENGPCGAPGSGVPGVRAKGGDGVESGPRELWK